MPLLNENKTNEELVLLKEWSKLRKYVEDNFGKKPDIQTCLFLIGVNEIGQLKDYSRDEKQDVMHVGMCTVLLDVYYKFIHRDEDNWPHYECIKPLPAMFIKKQEAFIKKQIVKYFDNKVY